MGKWLYKKVKVTSHPYADKRGFVLAHRLIVEEHLGRFLTPEEVVHHKDGNSENNSIDNLEVTTKQQHAKKHSSGVTYVDFVCATCGCTFQKPKRGKKYKYCSRECLFNDVSAESNRVKRQEGHARYLDNIRLSEAERKKRKAERQRRWRKNKKNGL